jgi:C-terminal processing protease CtpA/Prc
MTLSEDCLLSQVSEYYSIEHIVAAVREGSPAWEAGLRVNDLITHVHVTVTNANAKPFSMHTQSVGLIFT